MNRLQTLIWPTIPLRALQAVHTQCPRIAVNPRPPPPPRKGPGLKVALSCRGGARGAGDGRAGAGAGGDGAWELWEGCAADPGVALDEGLARGVGPEAWMGLRSQAEAAAKGKEFVPLSVKFRNAYVEQSNRWAGSYLCFYLLLPLFQLLLPLLPCCCSWCPAAAAAAMLPLSLPVLLLVPVAMRLQGCTNVGTKGGSPFLPAVAATCLWVTHKQSCAALGTNPVAAGGAAQGRGPVAAAGAAEGRDPVAAAGAAQGRDPVAATGAAQGRDPVAAPGLATRDWQRLECADPVVKWMT